jgi:hypothetical protein
MFGMKNLREKIAARILFEEAVCRQKNLTKWQKQRAEPFSEAQPLSCVL